MLLKCHIVVVFSKLLQSEHLCAAEFILKLPHAHVAVVSVFRICPPLPFQLSNIVTGHINQVNNVLLKQHLRPFRKSLNPRIICSIHSSQLKYYKCPH